MTNKPIRAAPTGYNDDLMYFLILHNGLAKYITGHPIKNNHLDHFIALIAGDSCVNCLKVPDFLIYNRNSITDELNAAAHKA